MILIHSHCHLFPDSLCLYIKVDFLNFFAYLARVETSNLKLRDLKAKFCLEMLQKFEQLLTDAN